MKVPPVKVAVILKALTARGRGAAKDLTDLGQLLAIRNRYSADEIGDWRLDQHDLTGSRRDAAAALHHMADQSRNIRAFDESGFSPVLFTALVRRLVARPA